MGGNYEFFETFEINKYLKKLPSMQRVKIALMEVITDIFQVVKLRKVFPHGCSLVLEFEYMLSDLSEVIRNSDKPLSEAQVKSYMLMLLKGIAFCHENNIMHRVSLQQC